MPNGLMQLVAYGAEDLYLTGNPQITFFKVVYRRHTNFAMEYIEQYFDSLPTFSASDETLCRVQIERYGDLMYDTYLVYDLPNIRFPYEKFEDITPENINFKWIRNVGQWLINYAQIQIGGYQIDKQYGMWLNIWNDLTLTDDKRPAYNKMIGNYAKLRPGISKYYPDKGDNYDIPATRLYIPMEFWFCKNPGLALPLIALQNGMVYIYINFNPLNELFTLGPNNLSPTAYFSPDYVAINQTASQLCSAGFNYANIFSYLIAGNWTKNTFLLVNYIYLDEDERRRFAMTSHEYLIHQVQTETQQGITYGPNTVRLDNFFHPVKELIWVLQKDNVSRYNNWFNYTFLDYNYDYLNLVERYQNKFDNLLQPFDTEFGKFVNDFIVNNELNPCSNVFLGSGLSETLAFNEYDNIFLFGKLIFNGQDRFEPRDYKFFNSLQSYKYHTHSASPGICIYSFALFPEQEQPSGTANFSRISKIELQFNVRRDICPDNGDGSDELVNTNQQYNMFIFALSYNILRIAGGLGGIAFQT